MLYFSGCCCFFISRTRTLLCFVTCADCVVAILIVRLYFRSSRILMFCSNLFCVIYRKLEWRKFKYQILSTVSVFAQTPLIGVNALSFTRSCADSFCIIFINFLFYRCFDFNLLGVRNNQPDFQPATAASRLLMYVQYAKHGWVGVRMCVQCMNSLLVHRDCVYWNAGGRTALFEWAHRQTG